MFVRTIRLAACVAVLFALAGSVLAAPTGQKPADYRVTDAMKHLSYEYEISKSGAVLVMIPVGEDRVRQVVIASETDTVKGKEVRLMYSSAQVYSGTVPTDAAAYIKAANERLKTGQLVVVDGANGTKMVMFVTFIKADASSGELDGAIKAVFDTTVAESAELTKLR